MTHRKKGILLVLVGASMWGASGVAGQYVLQRAGFSAEWLVVSRMLLAGIVLLVIDAVRERGSILEIWQEKRDAYEVIAFAVCGMVAVQYTYFACIKAGNAATATVLQYLMPIVIVLYDSVTARHLPRFIEVLSVVLAVTGTFLLVTHGDANTLAIPHEALFWGLASALAGAFYTMQPKRLIRKWRATLVIGWGMLIGGLLFSFVCPPWQFTGVWTPISILLFAYIVVFGTILAFSCYLGSLKYIRPGEAGVLASVEPLAAIVLSIAFLATPFSLMDVLGTTCILSTIFILARR